MEYQLALSPDLGLSAADFVSTWNEDAHLRSQAEARLASAASSTYFDPSLAGMAIDFAIGVGSGLTSAGLYELIKKLLEKRGVHQRTHFVEVTRPDGTHIIVLDVQK